jgi:hypothetical protein
MSSAGSVNSGSGIASNAFADVSVTHDKGNRYTVQIGNRTMTATVNDSHLQSGDKAKVAELLRNILTQSEINKEVSKGLSEYHIDVPFKGGSEAGSIRSKDAEGQETSKEVAFDKGFLQTISSIYSDCMQSLRASLQRYSLGSEGGDVKEAYAGAPASVSTHGAPAALSAAGASGPMHSRLSATDAAADIKDAAAIVNDATDSAVIAVLPAEADAVAADGVPEPAPAAPAPAKATATPEMHEAPAATNAAPVQDQADNAVLPDAGLPPKQADVPPADSAAPPEQLAQPLIVPQPSIPSKDDAAAQKPIGADAEKIEDESREKVSDNSSDSSALDDAGPSSLAAGMPAEVDFPAEDAASQQQSIAGSQYATPRSSVDSEIDSKGQKADARWHAASRASSDSDASSSDTSISEPASAKPAQSSVPSQTPEPVQEASAAAPVDKAELIKAAKENIKKLTANVNKYMSKINKDQPLNAYMAISRLRKLEREVARFEMLNPTDKAPADKFIQLQRLLHQKINNAKLELNSDEQRTISTLSFAKKDAFKELILKDGKINPAAKNLLMQAVLLSYSSSPEGRGLLQQAKEIQKQLYISKQDPEFKKAWSKAVKDDKNVAFLLRDVRKL